MDPVLIVPIPPQRAEIDRILALTFGSNTHALDIQPIPGGNVNAVYRIVVGESESYVLRVAPSAQVAAEGPSWFTPFGLRRERSVMAAAAGLAHVLPVTVANGFDHAVLDRDWVVQQAIPGLSMEAFHAPLAMPERESLWEQLGRLTRTLGDISGERFGPPSWGPTFESWSGLLSHDVGGFIDDAGRFAVPMPAFARLQRAIDTLQPALDDVTVPSLIHSDLSPAHVFVDIDEDGRPVVTGLIDFEFGRFADPLSESILTWLEQERGQSVPKSAFLRGYGREEFSPDERRRLKLYVAISLGWWVTLLAYQQRPYEGVLAEMTVALDELESLGR